jgi:hypothetical protein
MVTPDLQEREKFVSHFLPIGLDLREDVVKTLGQNTDGRQAGVDIFVFKFYI